LACCVVAWWRDWRRQAAQWWRLPSAKAIVYSFSPLPVRTSVFHNQWSDMVLSSIMLVHGKASRCRHSGQTGQRCADFHSTSQQGCTGF
jgi:hypothetical protein